MTTLTAREPSAKYLSNQQPPLVQHFELMSTAPGGVAKLRELILTLAVQGKLVQQDRCGEAANASDLPLLASVSQVPVSLPTGWHWVRLVDLKPSFQNGASSRGDAGGRQVIVVRLADIKERRISLKDPRRIPINEREVSKYLLTKGDILITRVNGSAEIVGQFNLCDADIEAIYCDHFIRMRVSEQLMVPEFLALLGQSALVRDRIKGLFITTAGQKTVNQTHIGSLEFGRPPLPEQARIVTRVEELMRLCDALEAKGQLEAAQHAQLVQTLLGALTASASPEELADNWQRVATHFDLLLNRPEAIDALEQTILQLAVRGLLVPQDPNDEPASELLKKIRAEKDRLIAEGKIKRDKPLPPILLQDIPFVVPKMWNWCRLSDVALHGPTNGLSPRPVDTPTDVRCLSLSATTQGSFRPECFKYVEIPPGQAEQFALKRGDLLVQRGNSLDYVGIAALYDGPDDAYIFPDLMMRLRLSQSVDAAYVHLAMVCAEGRDYFKRNATGTQGTMPKVNQATVGGAPLPLPPAAEMLRIVTRVESLRRLCTDLRQRLAARQSTQAHLAEALIAEVA